MRLEHVWDVTWIRFVVVPHLFIIILLRALVPLLPSSFPCYLFSSFFFWCLPSPNLFFFPPYALAALLPPFISFLLSLYSFFSLSFLYFSTFALTSLLPSAPFHLIPHFLAATSCSRNLIDSHTFPETNHGPHSPQYNNAPTCFRHSSWAA